MKLNGEQDTMSLTNKQVAALAGTQILWDCLLDDRTWTCWYCGHDKNWIAYEICDKCNIEDCAQGDADWIP